MNLPDICSPPGSWAFYLLYCQNRKGTKTQVCGSEFLVTKKSSIALAQSQKNIFCISAQ